MSWICKVCLEKADYILEYGSSRMNKKGIYKCKAYGYCKKHKPFIDKVEDEK